MSKISDLIEAEVQAAESAGADVDAPLPSSTRASRGNGRSKTLQVRLNEDEFRMLEKLAAEDHLPLSTFARSLLLKTIGY